MFITNFWPTRFRSPLKVWKSYLDQVEDVAKKRIAVAEKAQTEVADKIKTVKSSKTATFKKVRAFEWHTSSNFVFHRKIYY